MCHTLCWDYSTPERIDTVRRYYNYSRCLKLISLIHITYANKQALPNILVSALSEMRGEIREPLNSNIGCCCGLFGINVAFNNFSVISRRYLVATGSSMLTFIVLPHWSIMPQTLDMIPHRHIILTLGRPVLALPRKYECQARSS